LLEVVPLDSWLEIEAMVQNRDIGFAHGERNPEIKVDTVNFTKYGLLHSTVPNISAHSIGCSKLPSHIGKKASLDSEAADSATEPHGGELVCAAHVSLDRTSMDDDGRDVPPSPCRAVTVEIKTGALPAVAIAPFTHDSLHER
jgi:hemolysin D